MSDHCRQVFAHDPGSCTCVPFRVIELNRSMSAEQRRKDRFMLLAVGVVTFAISLIGLAIAAQAGLSRAEAAYQQDARI